MTTTLPFADRLLDQRAAEGDEQPFFTVAIPQYGRRKYLEVGLASIFEQKSASFEIVVSDDCSKDDSNAVLPGVLRASGCAFRYYAQPKNLGYDGQLRFLMATARGRYVLLLGNDDALASPTVLAELEAALRQLKLPKVAFGNSVMCATGEMIRRAFRTGVIGSGPATAVAMFRTFSFVAGLIFDREWAQRYETDRWDASVFYQIYLASKILARGGEVAAIDLVLVRQDTAIDGKVARGHWPRMANAKWSLAPRQSGMDNVIRVTADAVLPEVPPDERSQWAWRIVRQVLLSSYPWWLTEYRFRGNWGIAAGLARGMWPPLYTKDLPTLDRWHQLSLLGLYAGVTATGLTLPTIVLRRWGPELARRIRRKSQGLSTTAA